MRKVTVKLKDICTKVTDGTHDSPPLLESGMPFIKGVHVKEGRIKFDECDFISINEHEKVIKRSKPERGDTLFANIGINLGESAYVNSDIEFSIKNVALFKPDTKKIDGRYLFYLLITPREQALFKNKKSGSAQPFLSLASLRNHEVEIYNQIPTQQRIASILSAYDDLIENNLRRIQLLEDAARCEYKMMMEESENEIDTKLIEDVCDTIGGGTPSTKVNEYWQDGDVDWFTPTDFTKNNSLVLINSSKKINEKGLQKSSAKMFPSKTIMMTSRATIGFFGIYNKPACTNQGFINILPHKEYLRFYILFNLMERKEEIISHANGSTYLEITKSNFRKMKIKVPKDIEYLESFETKCQNIFNLVEKLLLQNNHLRQARDILLPKLMSGEIEV